MWKSAMTKLERTLNEINKPESKTIYDADLVSQVEFNTEMRELCRQYDIPQSLITALMLNHVANVINQAEGNNARYKTLKEFSECLKEGNGNWMAFIPQYKPESHIYIDRLDIGLIEAFYTFHIKQGSTPEEAFAKTKTNNEEVVKFFCYAMSEVGRQADKISSAWFTYADLYVYAGRSILGNPVNPSDFGVHTQPRKGIVLS